MAVENIFYKDPNFIHEGSPCLPLLPQNSIAYFYITQTVSAPDWGRYSDWGNICILGSFFSLNLQNPTQSWGIPRPQTPPETEGTQGDSDEGCLHQLSHTSKAVAMVLVRHQSRAAFSGQNTGSFLKI